MQYPASVRDRASASELTNESTLLSEDSGDAFTEEGNSLDRTIVSALSFDVAEDEVEPDIRIWPDV
jgi:hypothetical protein